MAEKTTRLSKLRISELSGVDDPANELPGWVVAKSKEFKSDVESFEQHVVGLHKALSDESTLLYFSDAPDEVQKSLGSVVKFLGDGLEEVEGEEPAAERTEKQREGVAKRLRDIFFSDGDVAKAAEAEAEAEETETEKGKAKPTPKDPDGDGDDDSTEEGDTDDDQGSGGGKPAEPKFGSPEWQAKYGKKGKMAKEAGAAEAEVSVQVAGPSADEIAKSLGDVIKPLVEKVDEVAGTVDVLKESLGGIADRTESLEKHAAGRSSLMGQEAGDEGEPETGLAKAVGAALRNGRVELN